MGNTELDYSKLEAEEKRHESEWKVSDEYLIDKLVHAGNHGVWWRGGDGSWNTRRDC